MALLSCGSVLVWRNEQLKLKSSPLTIYNLSACARPAVASHADKQQHCQPISIPLTGRQTAALLAYFNTTHRQTNSSTASLFQYHSQADKQQHCQPISIPLTGRQTAALPAYFNTTPTYTISQPQSLCGISHTRFKYTTKPALNTNTNLSL